MGGFCALYTRDGQPCPDDLFSRMSLALAGRGESMHQWRAGPVGLAMTTWHEHDALGTPFSPGDGRSSRAWVVADAHLHQRDALVHTLKQHGYSLTDPTDYACLAAAYAVWGVECVRHLRGDFAFVLWDPAAHRLFGARSPMGLRPFVYHVCTQHVLCASEALSLLEASSVSRTLHDSWASYWLVHATGHWDGTIFRDIEELLPGHRLVVDRDGLHLSSFWHPPPRPSRTGHRQEASTQQFRVLFSQAVERCMETADPLLFDLSGGLDSSSIVCMAATIRHGQADPPPWSAFHARTDADHFVHAVAEASQIPVTSLEYRDHLPFDGVWEPQPWFARPCLPALVLPSFYQQQWAIAAALGVRVHIRGDFGDELLGGLLEYLTTCWQERRLLHLVRELIAWKRLQQVPVLSLMERWIVQPSLRPKPAPSVPWLRPLVMAHDRERQARDDASLRAACPDPFQRRLFRWMRLHGDYTAQADVALQAGLETREPYSDLDVIEFLLATPPQYQVRPGQRKFLLREAMHGLLPECVRLRQDKGHAYRLFFQGIAKHRRALRDLAHHMPDLLTPYIDSASLVQTIDRVALGESAPMLALSGTLSLLLWAHRFPGTQGRLPVVPARGTRDRRM